MGKKEKNKQSKKVKNQYNKTTQNNGFSSSDRKKVVWVFDQIDLNGGFAFQLNKIKANKHLDMIFDKMIQYESMTWVEIKQQTHDKTNKSKHHFLDMDGMSSEACKRISQLHLEEYSDAIFSFALTNKLRIIGIRDEQYFHVKWYDPEHGFYPSTK